MCIVAINLIVDWIVVKMKPCSAYSRCYKEQSLLMMYIVVHSSLEMEQLSSPIKSDTSPATEERVYAIIGQEEPGSKPPEVAYENVATRR